MAPHNVEFVTFDGIFFPEGQPDRFFSIPQHQRSYSWDPEQRSDLLRDLQILKETRKTEPDHQHFFGTITVVHREGQNGSDKYDIVDAQQRITSLLILHALICRGLQTDSQYLPGHKHMFIPQKADRSVFRKVLENSAPGLKIENEIADVTTDAQKKYIQAGIEFSDWIEKQCHSDDEKRMYKELIEYGLSFIFFHLGDKADVGLIFETINNRGKPLSQMELVKNHLISVEKTSGYDEQVDVTWQKILEIVADTKFRSGEDADTVLRATVNAIFYPSKRKKYETDYKIIKRKLSEKASENWNDAYERFGTFLNFLEKNFRTFKELRDSFDTKTDEESALTFLNLHENIAGVLPLLFCRKYFKKSSAQEAPILHTIEKANFRLYGLFQAASRSDSYNVVLHNLAHDYFFSEFKKPRGSHPDPVNLKVSFRGMEFEAQLESVLEQIVCHATDVSELVQRLTVDDTESGIDFYKWKNLRYFLARFEADKLNKQSFDYSVLGNNYRDSQSGDYYSREHIFAKELNSPHLKEYLGGIVFRRLGNFMLLSQGLNSELGNKNIEDKIAKIGEAENRLNILIQNRDIKSFYEKAEAYVSGMQGYKYMDFESRRTRNKQTINPNHDLNIAKVICDLREEQMIEFALRMWLFESERNEAKNFIGIFSFADDGDLYLSTTKKSSQNYIWEPPGTGSNASRLREVRCAALKAAIDIPSR